MRTPKQTSVKVDKACKAIEAQLKGRTHPREREIIAIECEKSDISESHIRTIMEIPETRRKSNRYR